MQVFYCDHFELPLPSGHRFPIQKYQRTREKVAERLGENIRLAVAPAATKEELVLVHSEAYVAKTFSGDLSELEQKRIGFPWSPKMLERSRRSTGATIATAAAALKEGIAAHLSGGTHHAFIDEGQGFCVFNDVAVAIRVLQDKQRITSALVVDLDVHQGNGTASIFANDPSVFTFSMHGDRNYPFRKTSGDLDYALMDGTGDSMYLDLLQQALEQNLDDTFDIVFFIAGADAHEGDRMGRVKLSTEGIALRDEAVIRHFANRKTPIVVVMGGGYGEIEVVSDLHAQTVGIAYDYWNRLRSDAVH